MRLHAGDTLTINYGDGIEYVTVANGLDHIQNCEERIKVIFKSDSSYNPVTINTKDILKVNGIEINNQR